MFAPPTSSSTSVESVKSTGSTAALMELKREPETDLEIIDIVDGTAALIELEPEIELETIDIADDDDDDDGSIHSSSAAMGPEPEPEVWIPYQTKGKQVVKEIPDLLPNPVPSRYCGLRCTEDNAYEFNCNVCLNASTSHAVSNWECKSVEFGLELVN